MNECKEATAQALLRRARARARARLDRCSAYPIVVVAAPAGFGKSTVVREFIAANTRPYRCLQLEAKSADLFGFMRAFAHCLGDLVPALLTSFMGVYDRMHRAGDAHREIAAWAAGHLGAIDLTLVIDGLENVSDERLFLLLNEIVDQAEATNVRWVLIAPTADCFPIARWLANDRMDLPLDGDDLALVYDDLLAAVEQARAPVPPEVLRALCQMAENWPAAIALALGDLGSPTEFLDGAQPYAYFADRAFAARSENERRFLLETCLYRHFDAALLAHAGWNDSQPMLERLRDAGAIIFFQAPGVYRFHEIFRAYLQERLQSSPNDLNRRVRAASARVCRSVGRWTDALELYVDLQAATPLAELLSERGFELVDRGEADLVYRGLAALTDVDFTAFPAALAVKASLESLHGNFDLAEAWFRHAIQNASESSRGPIVFRFATDLVRQERRDAIDFLEPIVAEGGQDRELTVLLAGLLATAYARDQQNTQAAFTIARALEALDGVDDPAVRAKLFYQAGYVAFFARDSGRAKGFAQAAVETALALHLYDIAARALSILYSIAMDYEDDVRAALRYLNQLASCSVKAGSRHLQLYATLGQFEIEVFRGNLIESARLDDELKELEVEYSTFASEMLLPAQALRATWSGDFHRAYRLIATTAENQITPRRQSQRHAEIALYAAAAGLRAEAAATVRRALVTEPKDERIDKSVAFTKAYIALTLNMLGRHQRAARVTEELRSSPELTPRLKKFVDVIAAINDRWATGTYRANLSEELDELAAFDLGGICRLIEALPLPETLRGEFGGLTRPEREVLVQLAAGLSSARISELSSRSAELVDALVRSLCRKLGCKSPRDAVALAQSSEMLGTQSERVR